MVNEDLFAQVRGLTDNLSGVVEPLLADKVFDPLIFTYGAIRRSSEYRQAPRRHCVCGASPVIAVRQRNYRAMEHRIDMSRGFFYWTEFVVMKPKRRNVKSAVRPHKVPKISARVSTDS